MDMIDTLYQECWNQTLRFWIKSDIEDMSTTTTSSNPTSQYVIPQMLLSPYLMLASTFWKRISDFFSYLGTILEITGYLPAILRNFGHTTSVSENTDRGTYQPRSLSSLYGIQLVGGPLRNQDIPSNP